MYFANGQSQSNLFVEIMIQMMLLVHAIRIDYVNCGIAMSAHDRRLQKIKRSKRYQRYTHTCTSSIPTISFSWSYMLYMELSPVNPGSGELALNATVSK